MAKRTIGGRMSNEELELRRYHRTVSRVRSACSDQDVELHSYAEAADDEKCVLSRDEYELGASREYVSTDNESYFVEEQYYQDISDKALYL